MLHAGLDLSRKRLDVCVLTEEGEQAAVLAVPPDLDGLRGLAMRFNRLGLPVTAAIETMNGSRFVHDQLELCGWDVKIADAQKVKGLAPLACKTDRIDAHVLAELSRRDLVPEVWLPDPAVRAERERARFRLHLVKHRTALKNRIHSCLLAFGHPCPVTDLFGRQGRELLDKLEFPEPWRSSVLASVALIDDLDQQISQIASELRDLGADHRYVPLLQTVLCPWPHDGPFRDAPPERRFPSHTILPPRRRQRDERRSTQQHQEARPDQTPHLTNSPPSQRGKEKLSLLAKAEVNHEVRRERFALTARARFAITAVRKRALAEFRSSCFPWRLLHKAAVALGRDSVAS